MDLNTLTAISPVDGRYHNKTKELSNYFSEYALIKYRVYVEIQYFIALAKIPLPQLKNISKKQLENVKSVFNNFNSDDAARIKKIEAITNHDVKAVEYFIKEKFKEINLSGYSEFIHFGLTSQDINNTAVPLSLKEAVHKVYLPALNKLNNKLHELAEQWKDIPMLARTHGQPASPTRLGKEVLVFTERIEKQTGLLNLIPFSAKFGGATGNFNAHNVAYPDIDWVEFANAFVNQILELDRSRTTTQIDHYDNLAACFDSMKRINTIFIDLSRDVWTYVSMDYFKQRIKQTEVGSSAMPHKVNPIDFENAEGNLGIANALFSHLSEKLPISRLQRDLTDSTVLRNIGIPVSHTLIAFKSLLKGLDKLIINEEKIKTDLENNWVVVAEAIQTVLRREGVKNPYEELKKLTRNNKKIDQITIINFIESLTIDNKIKEELKQITPFNYTGI